MFISDFKGDKEHQMHFPKGDKDHLSDIRVIRKDAQNGNFTQIKEEIRICQTLNHPNIQQYYETYVDVKFIYMVKEHISTLTMLE